MQRRPQPSCPQLLDQTEEGVSSSGAVLGAVFQEPAQGWLAEMLSAGSDPGHSPLARPQALTRGRLCQKGTCYSTLIMVPQAPLKNLPQVGKDCARDSDSAQPCPSVQRGSWAQRHRDGRAGQHLLPCPLPGHWLLPPTSLPKPLLSSPKPPGALVSLV